MGDTLTIDVGNTALKWAVWESGRLVERGVRSHGEDFGPVPQAWRGVNRVGVATVAHGPAGDLEAHWPTDLPPIEWLRDFRDVPLELAKAITDPGGVGVDRLLNVLGWRDAHPGEPAIIVDFGTAITLDLCDRDGRFAGGLILPGADLIARALGAETSRLPEISITPESEGIGTDTASAISRGVSGLILGGVERQIRTLLAAFDTEARVVATGGSASTWTPSLPSIERIIPDLTLRAIAIVLAKKGSP